ncbi:MAG: recombinase family protein [Faecalibacterium sp.]
MRAALYCRLSREDEDADAACGRPSESIQNQKAMLTRYAAEQGWEVAGIYCDEDYSGMDRSRPAFNRLLKDAKQGKFELVLAKTQSRFTRDMELVERYLHGEFARWGVRFVATVDHVDTADPAGKKSRQINGLVNEWYLEDLSHNVRAVLDSKRRRGQYIAAFALYGYRKDLRDKHQLRIDPEAAAVVRQIFALYLSGEGMGRIARRLNQEGVPSPALYRSQKGLPAPAALPGMPLWSKAVVGQILHNRTYTGDLVQGRRRRLSYKSRKTLRLPPDQWMVVQGTHEAIVAPEVFETAQQLAAQRARSGKEGRVHPLARRVVCGLCGGIMEQTGSSLRRYYRCRSARRCPQLCPGQPYLPAADAERLVLERLRRILEQYFDPDSIPAPTRFQVRDETETLSALRMQARRRQDALEMLYLDKCSGLVSEEQFRMLNGAYQAQLERCQARIAALEQPSAASPQAEKSSVAQRAACPQKLTRGLAGSFVERLVVYPPDGDGIRRLELFWQV